MDGKLDMELDDYDSDSQVDPEANGVFELIRRVEARPVLYNCRDPNHSKKNVLHLTWKELAVGLKINGVEKDAIFLCRHKGEWCRKKWKTLKKYYKDKRNEMKGKSGDGAGRKKQWSYYAAVERVLSAFNEENENTQSNYPGDDSDSPASSRPDTPLENPDSDRQEENGSMNDAESTPSVPKSSGKKRKAADNEKLINEKILQILEEPEETNDEFDYFGMTMAKKLRKLSPQVSDYAMMRLNTLLYEISYPPPPCPPNCQVCPPKVATNSSS